MGKLDVSDVLDEPRTWSICSNSSYSSHPTRRPTWLPSHLSLPSKKLHAITVNSPEVSPDPHTSASFLQSTVLVGSAQPAAPALRQATSSAFPSLRSG